MTRKELIEMLNILLDNAEIGCADITAIKHVSFDSFKFAIEQTIKELSQEPTDTWSIKDVADTFKKHGLIREQEPCDDAISREMALNSLIDNTNLEGYELAEALDAIENKEKLPPVTQKFGKWINKDVRKAEYVLVGKCSVCGQVRVIDKLCSNCGAKMGK